MPRNGTTGAYTRAVTPPVNGDVADADLFNDEMDDFATAITNSLARNGEALPTANLPMGGFVHTGLGAGDANGESVRYEQVSPLFRPLATVLSATILSGFLYGLGMQNNASDATNDIDIAAGICLDSTNAKLMPLASALTKQLDAAWAVGTGNGGLDTGSIANTTYHVWLIMRSDTGVVDALFSTSATSPTMPANYDYKRRIGSILRESAAIVGFVQDGDLFMRKVSAADVAATNPGTSAVTRTLSVPTGIRVEARMQLLINTTTTSSAFSVTMTDLSQTDSASNAASSDAAMNTLGTAGTYRCKGYVACMTNTSAQVRSRMATSDASSSLSVNTTGWTDTRGRAA